MHLMAYALNFREYVLLTFTKASFETKILKFQVPIRRFLNSTEIPSYSLRTLSILKRKPLKGVAVIRMRTRFVHLHRE